MNRSRLRLLAILVAINSLVSIGQLLAMWSADPMNLRTIPDSWADAAPFLLFPLVGAVGLFAAAGIWLERRWGAVAFAVWAALALVRFALVLAFLPAMTEFAWQAVAVAALVLLGAIIAVQWVVRWVWRSVA